MPLSDHDDVLTDVKTWDPTDVRGLTYGPISEWQHLATIAAYGLCYAHTSKYYWLTWPRT